MGVTTEIFNRIAMSVKGLLNKAVPVCRIKLITEELPLHRIFKRSMGFGKNEFTSIIKTFKVIQEFPAKLSGENPDRNEEAFLFVGDITAAQVKAGAGNDGMNMGMVVETLAPCMENLDNSGNCTEKLSVDRQLENSFGGAFMDKVIKQALIGVEQRIQLFGDSKDKMVVRTVNDF